MYQINEEVIGNNAGKLWHILNDKGSLTKYQVLKNIDLSENDFFEAVGWLACENKIKKEGEFYKLDQTNLIDIGLHADLLIEVLNEINYSITDLDKVTKMSEEELHQAIGWLSREGKLHSLPDNFNTDYFSEQEEKIQYMQEEIIELKEELSDRNLLIESLSHQINDVQIDLINNSDVVDQLTMQISNNQNSISDRIKLFSDAQSEINLLKSEINTLQEDLHVRNTIINELSRQLTDSQSDLIHKSDAFENLQNTFNKMQNLNKVSTNNLQQKFDTIDSLQDKIDDMANKINSTSSTKLFDKNSPALEIQRNEELNTNVIDSSVVEENNQSKEVLAKKNMDGNDSINCNE